MTEGAFCMNDKGELFEQHELECAGLAERHGLHYVEISYRCLNCGWKFTELQRLAGGDDDDDR